MGIFEFVAYLIRRLFRTRRGLELHAWRKERKRRLKA